MDTITDAKFMTDGCPGAVTSTAALSEILKGKKIREATKLGVSDVVKFLEEGAKGLPKNMQDCCGIAVGALEDAIPHS